MLDVDFRRKHDDALRRHAEELGRLRAAPLQVSEHLGLESSETRPRLRAHQVPADEVGAIGLVDAQPALARATNGFRDVWVSMKPKRACTACTFGMSSSTQARETRSCRGERTISKFMIRICSWQT